MPQIRSLGEAVEIIEARYRKKLVGLGKAELARSRSFDCYRKTQLFGAFSSLPGRLNGDLRRRGRDFPPITSLVPIYGTFASVNDALGTSTGTMQLMAARRKSRRRAGRVIFMPPVNQGVDTALPPLPVAGSVGGLWPAPIRRRCRRAAPPPPSALLRADAAGADDGCCGRSGGTAAVSLLTCSLASLLTCQLAELLTAPPTVPARGGGLVRRRAAPKPAATAARSGRAAPQPNCPVLCMIERA
jgi:hypothetical protein